MFPRPGESFDDFNRRNQLTKPGINAELFILGKVMETIYKIPCACEVCGKETTFGEATTIKASSEKTYHTLCSKDCAKRYVENIREKKK